MTRKALSAAIWYIIVTVLAIMVVLVVVTMFGKNMEITSNNTKENINMTFTPLQCIPECERCCSKDTGDVGYQADCSVLPSECECNDDKPAGPGC